MRKFKKFASIPLIFLSLMIVVLAAMLGAACTPKSKEPASEDEGDPLGESFELSCMDEANRSWIVFKVSAPKIKDAEGNETAMNVRLHDVYVHASKICSKEETATMELQWGSATTPVESFFTLNVMKKAVFFNPDYAAKEGDTPTEETDSHANYLHEWQNRWVAPFGVSDIPATSLYKSLSSPLYFKLVLPSYGKYQNSNMGIDEIVFVGEVQDENGGTGEYVVLSAEFDGRTYLDYKDQSEGLKKAAALLDAQQVPLI